MLARVWAIALDSGSSVVAVALMASWPAAMKISSATGNAILHNCMTDSIVLEVCDCCQIWSTVHEPHDGTW